jgi:predicted DNA-binding transcriptional regulator AlpA
MGREILSDEAAAIAGVERKTWTAYVARKQAPAPVRHVGRTPLWDEDEIRSWYAKRPRAGKKPAATGDQA